MRRLPLLLALAGIAAAAALVLRFDAGGVWAAMTGIGWRGAALLLAFQGALFCLLGLAWATVQPDLPAPLLIWGRMVRDAATTCLPFSPVGGYVLGVRAVSLRGPAWTVAAAGTAVDVSAEIVAQMLFTLAGVGVLLALHPGSGLVLPVGAGTVVALGLLLLLLSQRERVGRLVGALATRLLGEAARDAAALGHEAQHLYAARPRFLLGLLLHLLGWGLTGLATWTALRLLGLPLPILSVLALEALLDAAVAVAFAVPGAIGVQEAGYVGLGALFGVPPELSLGVSLLRRARELCWGVPILAVWQWQEVRRL